jgi:broad specificity phosphatase PhoE
MTGSNPLVLLLIRHGQSQANQAGTFQGRLDSELSPLGRAQGEKLSRHLASFPIQALYSSPLLRARITAELITRHHALSMRMDENLAEVDVGNLAGKPYDSVQVEYPGFMKEFRRNPATTRFPAGETLAEVQARALAAVERIRQEQGDEGTIAVVSHNICLRAMALGLLGWGWDVLWQLALDPAAFCLLSLPASKPAVLVAWNVTAHLETMPKLKPSGLLGL